MATHTRLFSSSIGMKLAIGLTGLAMVGFLVEHMVGNLLLLVGPDAYNGYADVLISNPFVIPAELGLVAILGIHVYKAVRNYGANRAARPTRYAVKRAAGHTSRKSTASTSMIVTGAVILAFLILHLRTFKYGPHYLVDGTEVRDLYRLVIEVFAQPSYAAFYVLSMILVAMHLYHGVASAFQSLGIDGPRATPWLLGLGQALAIIMGAGFALIPMWILMRTLS